MKHKIIIWGHKLHSHTHSYIHAAFYKAFKYLDHETLWLDDSDNIEGLDTNECIFITEGQVDKKIPLNKTSQYILHNCDLEKYKELKTLNLQVYTNGVENSCGINGEKIEECIYYDKLKNVLYQPWATDLLPHEIDGVYYNNEDKLAVWIGSFCGGYHGNDTEFEPFLRALNSTNYKIKVYHPGTCSFEENISILRSHELAPSIVGRWQKVNGYVPCRIFKNISYGKLGLTNSKTVENLFKGSVLYDDNTFNLFIKYLHLNTDQKRKLFDYSNNLIVHNHTYINRINNLLKFL
jgi:hypothetical protein